MFHHGKLILIALVTPVTLLYAACAAPCLALLRAVGLRPSPPLPDEDLSGRVIIVTGANTGKWLRQPTVVDSRYTHGR